MSTRLWCGLFLVPLISSCSLLLVTEDCDFDRDCFPGQECIAGACIARPVDAGFLDGSVDPDPDVGFLDTGILPDNGLADADLGPCPTGRIMVSGAITESTTWSSDCVYVLTENIFIEGLGTVLTISAGTRVEGLERSALVATRGTRLDARGTRDAPVVFTSAKPVGMRAPGDWGGVALLGAAPINTPTGEAILEGLQDDPQGRGTYGGTEPTHSCGNLEYVRIEFAGFEAFLNNELNGLTLGGCGTDTALRFIQVHLGFDDGIEFFGGGAFMRNIVITRAQDDQLDWDFGWTGAGQFIVIQMDENSDNGFEASSMEGMENAMPRSNPKLYNVTIVGSRDVEGEGRGILLREGTAGELGNIIVMGHRVSGLDIDGTATSSCAQANIGCEGGGGALDLRGAIFYDLGPDGMTYGEPDAADDADGFDEAAWLASRTDVIFGQDPGLFRPFNLLDPNFEPIANGLAVTSTIAQTPPSQPEQFDRTDPFIGAIRRDDDWTRGWTSFPEN